MTITLQTESAAPIVIYALIKDDGLPKQLLSIAKQHKVTPSLLENDFKAAHKEVIAFYSNKKGTEQQVYLVGLGEKAGFSEVLSAFRSFIFQKKAKIGAHIAIDISIWSKKNLEIKWIDAISNGITLGRYDIGLYKTDKKEAPIFISGDAKVDIVTPLAKEAQLISALNQGIRTAETQLRIFDLMNAPGNKKTPTHLAKWAEKSGKEYGFKTTILEKKELEKEKIGALLSVSRGSPEDPVMIVMEYKPKGDKKMPKIGLIGKGVTFDTGGVSIKPSTNMHQMKSDMGGAAAVLGTMELVAKLGLPVHLIGVIPSTENCVDGKSTKPGDVITSYSGRTIEVIDTDAEGRLILCDAITYMVKHFAPDTMIDLATLTGSIIGTLGFAAAGMFTNNDELASDIQALGYKCGEKVWRMPLWDVYKDDISSDVADLRNFSGKPMAGAISAAKFLEVFTDNHTAWMHLDIAGVAFTDGEFAMQKSSTAYGIRLLSEYVKGRI
jgi:leucyl aminopeptidase